MASAHLAAFCATLAAFFADEAAAKNCKTGTKAATVLLLLHNDLLGRALLVLHLFGSGQRRRIGPGVMGDVQAAEGSRRREVVDHSPAGEGRSCWNRQPCLRAQ